MFHDHLHEPMFHDHLHFSCCFKTANIASTSLTNVFSSYHDPNPPRDDYRYNDDKYRDDESYRNNYRGNQPYDDGYRSNHARGDGYQRDQYHDDRYQGNQSYDDGYQGNRGYNDGYQGNRSYGNDYGASDGHQDYQRSDFDNRQPSYGDSEFDDDNQREGYGYQPASMI